MYTADTLSRAPLSTEGDSSLTELAQLAMDAYITHLPASSDTLSTLEQTQNADPVCSMIIKYCRSGWPGKMTLSEVARPYWEARGKLNLNGILLLHDSNRHTCLKTTGHPDKNPCRTSRNTEMSSPSETISVVAWDINTNRELRQDLSTLLKKALH